MIQRIFRSVSDKSRQRKLGMFYEYFEPSPRTTVLDLGGEASHAGQPNVQLLSSYPYPGRVTLANLNFADAKRAAEVTPGLKSVCADGCCLPFADKQFDICYCNAVIEHLFTRDNQARFAAEIMRVARNWFVTTPNRWFPFEPHMRLPVVTWLPQPWQREIGRAYSYSHVLRKYMSGLDWSELLLLGRQELKRLFPGSRVFRNGRPGWTPTLIAVGGEISQRNALAPLRQVEREYAT